MPLVKGGVPLLYPRYSTVEQLLQVSDVLLFAATSGACNSTADAVSAGPLAQLGKGGTPAAEPAAADHGTDRPSKKQKRGNAASTPDAAEPARSESPPPSKFAVVGEDGLTYKQRRQQRRAAERAAKAATEAAEAAAAPATVNDAEPATTAPSANGSADVKGSKREKKRAKGEETAAAADVAAASDPAAGAGRPPAAQNNSEEAARLRAVLGYAAAAQPAGPGPASALFAGLKGPAAVGEEPEPSGPASVDEGGKRKAKRVKGGAQAEGPAAAGPAPQVEQHPAEEAPATDAKLKKGRTKQAAAEADGPASVAAGAVPGGDTGQEAAEPGTSEPATDAPAAAAAVKARGDRRSGGAFSFRFKVCAGPPSGCCRTVGRGRPLPAPLTPPPASRPCSQLDAAVEAATQAKLAKLTALDAAKDGFVPRRVREPAGAELGQGQGQHSPPTDAPPKRGPPWPPCAGVDQRHPARIR